MDQLIETNMNQFL